MTKFLKKPLSILLAVLMVMSVFIAVPMTASALTGNDVQSLMDSMHAVIRGYLNQHDMEHAGPLINYYNSLSQAFGEANSQVTPAVESAYNAAYEYFMANSGAGVSYPDVNNVYRATDDPVNVTVSDLQPGDVIVTSSESLEVQKGNCTIVLVGGTCGEGEDGYLHQTYPNNVTLGDEIIFEFNDNNARIIDLGGNHGRYDPVYNNKLGNAYMVLGKDNGTVYLAGYNYTTYTITWNDYDGTNLYDGQSIVSTGTVPSYKWSVSRSSTAQYSYTFTGWTDSSNTFYANGSDLPAATKDETYTATYSETLRSYTITWKDGNNETLKSESVAYGTTPSYTGETPTKTEDDAYTYEFNNTWSPSVASVTGNATYTAQFTAVPKSAPTPKVAEVNGAQYESLEEAFAAANDGETITVLADCEGNGIIVPQGKFATGLTVDFGGNTYTVSGTPVGSRGTESIGFQLLKDNNITFQNGTITADCRVNPRDGKYLQRMIQNYSNLTLDDMTVSMIGQYYDQATISTCNGKTVIKDSTVSAPDFTWLGYNKSSDVGGVALTMGTFASYPSIDVKVTDGSTIDGDIKVSDDNNKKAFSLSLEDGSMNGNIVLDETAKAAIDDSPATASVKKADEFNQAAPEGYKWVATETAGVYKVAPLTLQEYVDETFGNIAGFTFADASANIDGISANSASLVGVQLRKLPADTQTTEYSYDEEGKKEAGLRFVATMSRALYDKYENVAGFDYGFEINGRKFSCKDSANNVAEGHENIKTASDYAVMTLALKGFTENNKDANLKVKFFVETAEDETVYADYAKAGSTAKEFTTTYNQVEDALS